MQCIRFWLLWLPGFFLPPAVSLAASSNCQTFSLENGTMQLSVQIKGGEYPAVLTTSNVGASISDRLARELRLTQRVDPDLRVVSDTGEEQEYLYSPDVPFTLFGIETSADRMAITESDSRFITLSLRLFDGLIIQINFPDSRICFVDRSALDLRREQNIELDSGARFGIPAIQVSLNDDFDTWLELSPGFGGGVRVDSFVADSLNLESEDDNQNPLYPFESATLDSLTFGPYQLGAIPVEFPKQNVRSNLTRRQETLTNTNVQDDRQTRGRIGIEVLKHFIVTLDLELERMHVFAP
ncbi:MAG: hypothetical protein R3F41_10525 [Gammaproteobacteria bacterium]|nr:hypothetical protein [Pseudomonadales bacterium]MCP5348042.1 hypothetical protein [Pseudomonadales bacterium]